MLIVISPAKNLGSPTLNRKIISEIDFPKESTELMKVLKTYKPEAISKLMKISPKLSELNYERNLKWNYPFTSEEKGIALHLFQGEVYRGIDIETFTENDFVFAQEHLRILSGLYGLLKPADTILPYRLEMGTKLQNKKGKNLYEFWGNKITEQINTILKNKNDNILVNLASNEYFKSIKKKKLNARIITPSFKEFRNGEYKNITVYAKKARGFMTRFIIKNKIENFEELKTFDTENYCYNEELSSINEIIFTR